MAGTARIEKRGQKQVLVLELSAGSEGFKDEITLFEPSQELKEGIAVSVLGCAEEKFFTTIDGNPVAFEGAMSTLVPELTTRCLAEALKDKTFQFQPGRT